MFNQLVACLSTNSKKVLLGLLAQNKPISAEQLSKTLGLSLSQVRYSVKKLCACLSFGEVKIQQKPNEGIFLIVDPIKRKLLVTEIQENEKSTVALNRDERVGLIIQYLLTSTKGFKLSEIRNMAGTSDTSFFRDLEKVKNWFKSFGIVLSAKRNDLIQLNGEELWIRKAIRDFFFVHLGQEFLIQACILPFEKIDRYTLKETFTHKNFGLFVSMMRLPESEKLICELENRYRCNFLDKIHIELTLNLGIMLARISAGKILMKTNRVSYDYVKEYSADAEKIIASLLPNLDIQSIPEEVISLAVIITKSFEQGTVTPKDNLMVSIERKKRSQAAHALVREIAKYFHAGLYEDSELIECIDWELGHVYQDQYLDDLPTVNPPENKIPENLINNIVTPVLEKEGISHNPGLIRRIYNHTFVALDRIKTTSIQRRVLLVCGSGAATAFSIKSQINSAIPEIDILGIASIFELVHDQSILDECDAIITTIPIGGITQKPQVIVKPLLDDSDIFQIKQVLGLAYNHKSGFFGKYLDTSQNPIELFSKNAILTHYKAENPKGVIEIVGKLLLDVDAVWPSYIKAMRNLYELYGPYMEIAPNTILLHAGPEMGAKRSAISLVTLSLPINFGHKSFDPVVIAMAYSSTSEANITFPLNKVFEFFGKQDNRARVLGADSSIEILNILKENI